MKIIMMVVALVFLPALTLKGSMGRVVRVADARTLVVDYGQTQSAVTLRGIDLSPTIETTQFLQTFVGSWVLVESKSDGTADVYRSPDALFLNDAIRRHGGGSPSVLLVEAHESSYLGIALPGPERAPARVQRVPSTRNARPRTPARIRQSRASRPRRPPRGLHPITFR